jgi:S1-C subfamily serine protease
MKPFPYLGPSLVVLIAGGVAIVSTPLVVRRVNDARADEQIVQAAHVLAQAGLPDERLALTQKGARDPLAGDHPLPSGASADPARATGGEPILEQINRANRAIARLVEPSVVHVSAQNSMQRRSFVAPYASSGSGWIWDDAGHIVTNAHVVDGAQRLQVQFFDGELRDAELVGLDLRTDIAVIKVDAGGLHPARRGDSASVEQGDMVFAFGSPFDFRFSMSAGIVSGLGRSTALDNIDYQNFIQTDAAINPGNSGGPLTDVRGRVIGMNTAIATNPGSSVGQAQFAGIGLAIPMAMIETTVTQIIDTGEVRKGYLGVELLSLDRVRMGATPFGDVLDRFKGEGAMLGRITAGSPAQQAGFRSGDIIVAIDGQKVTSDSAVRAIVSSRRPGDKVRFDIWRMVEGNGGDEGAGGGENAADAEPSADGGVRLSLTATLAELDVSVNLAPSLPRAMRDAGILTFSTSTPERARALQAPYLRGILIEQIAADSELASIVPKGSTITGIFNQSVGSVDEMYTRFARATETLGVPRGRRMPRMIEVPFTITVPDGRVVQILVPSPT